MSNSTHALRHCQQITVKTLMRAAPHALVIGVVKAEEAPVNAYIGQSWSGPWLAAAVIRRQGFQ